MHNDTLERQLRTEKTSVDSAFDRLMRTALRDPEEWADLTDTTTGINEAERWLKSTAISIDQQLAFRQDDLEALRLTGDIAEHASQSLDHLHWRKKVLYLKSLCQKRLFDIKRLQSSDESRAQASKSLLMQLAEAIVAHESGRLGDEGLHATLDRIELPGEETLTLREYLEMRAAPAVR